MKLDQLYTPYKNIPIYKVIVQDYREHEDKINYKLIFIGPVKDIAVRNCLLKLENEQPLTKNDHLNLKTYSSFSISPISLSLLF